MIDLNATNAAIRAGYSPKTAKQQGSRLLSKADIASAIQELQGKRLAKLEITADRVLSEISLLAFSRMDKYVRVDHAGMAQIDLSDLKDEDWAAVQEFTVDQTGGGAGDGERKAVERVRFKLADKGLNLERLGRHLQLFKDKVDVTVNVQLSEIIREVRERKREYERSSK